MKHYNKTAVNLVGKLSGQGADRYAMLLGVAAVIAASGVFVAAVAVAVRWW